MFVYRSNRLEELVDCLSQVVSKPLPHILSPEVILIQSAGMERYLSREVARRVGILAGARFPFPRAFIRDIFDQALGTSQIVDPFERNSMSWLLFSELRKAIGEPGFEALSAHLNDDIDSSRRLLLAERFAHLFDQYITYRPSMILDWAAHPPNENLQGKLWNRVCEAIEIPDFAQRSKRFLTELSHDELERVLPPRISVFGGPGLPPLYLEILQRMGQVVPVHVFALTVCRHYFFDTTSLARAEAETNTLHAHPLLSSLGQVGGDFQYLLEGLGGYIEGPARFILDEAPVASQADETIDAVERVGKRGQVTSNSQLSLFSEGAELVTRSATETSTTLTLLQRSLLEGQIENIERKSHEIIDDSITIDNCHSRLREVETLHDRLLDWFAKDPNLRPEDVVVLAPDIEAYSALIDAVFSARAGERPHIPYRVVDRSFRHEDSAARALLLGLQLLKSRFKIGDLLDLLQLEPVRNRYDVGSAELDRLTQWLTDVNIRCNVDESHRASLGLPAFDENTFRFGLRRLLLGYVLADDGDQIYKDIVPFDDIAVAEGPLLGRLCDLCEDLFSLRDRLVLAGPEGLSLKLWSNLLVELADTLLADSKDGHWDLGALRQSLYEIESRTRIIPDKDGEAELRLGLPAMMHILDKELQSTRFSSDFLSGGVTFCAMLPLRNVPFLHVCVLGLNQGDFPRNESADPLNLMTEKREPGDRSLRSDDRYLFLEILLSARKKLSLSYVGRSIQDNSLIPPSVLIAELSATVALLDGACRKLLVRQHPLQPFHPSYFTHEVSADTLPRSFDQSYFQGAMSLSAKKVSPPQLLTRALTPRPPPKEVILAEMLRYFKDPANQFLRHCGVGIQTDGATLAEREPVEAGPLDRYLVGERLLALHSRSDKTDETLELRRGMLPVGQAGRVLLEDISKASLVIAQLGKQLRSPEQTRVVHIDQLLVRNSALELQQVFEHMPELGDALQAYIDEPQKQFALSGPITGVCGSIRLVQSYGRQNYRRKLSLWIEHLALCCQDSTFESSVLLSRGTEAEPISVLGFARIEQNRARETLTTLCGLFYLGQHYPLPFIPDINQEFCEMFAREKTRGGDDPYGAAMYKAEQARAKGQSQLAQLYRDLDPLRPPSCEGKEIDELPYVRLALYWDTKMRATMFEGPASLMQISGMDSAS